MLLDAADLQFAYPSGSGRASSGAVRGGAAVLSGVTLRIEAGALTGILGPNGGGKTTLLRLLAGTLRPQRGRVMFDGRDVSAVPRRDLACRLAVVPQETQLAFDYTVLEIALMGRYPHLGAFEVEGPADVQCALDALDATGTRPLVDRLFSTLSGGEKQRVIIASALAQLADRPDEEADDGERPTYVGTRHAHANRGRAARVLLLDEPTASLDLRYQIEVAALLRRLHARGDVTIVLSTHDLHFARAVCRHIVLLGDGRILAAGSPAETLTAPLLEQLYGVDVTPAFTP